MTAEDFFRMLADETRLRCLVLLAGAGELCVCELTTATQTAQPKISRHLAQMRGEGVVLDRRQGQWVFYRLSPGLEPWMARVVAEAARGLAALPPFAADRVRLDAMPDRPQRCAAAPDPEDLMADPVFTVLFLCTGNSARSIMAECLLDHWGKGRFHAFSAGSHPRGAVHPLTLRLLEESSVIKPGLRSKDWSEFSSTSAPVLDFVFTVCDDAAGETCPTWPGQPITAHWGVPDPVKVDGSEVERMLAFRDAFRQLENRIKVFTSLRLEGLSRLALQRKVDDIGRL